jgi:Leucine-rich repeat (LRR) protein
MAMTSLNISNNNIGQPDECPEGWSYGLQEGHSATYEYKHTDGRKQNDPPTGSKSSGVTALANAIKDMGALSKFDISSNNLCAAGAKVLAEALKDNQVLPMGALAKFDISDNMLGPEGGKALAVCLKGNRSITELNIAANCFGMNLSSGECDNAGVIAIADAIGDMGAMTSLDVSNNRLFAEGTKLLAEALTSNQIMTALNVSSNYMMLNVSSNDGAQGVTALADAIPAMGAISSINLLLNDIPVKQAQKLVKIMQAKEKLTTLCGLSKEETELDFSCQGLESGDIVLIANDISDMRALIKLDVSNNSIDAKQEKSLQRICAAGGIELDSKQRSNGR